MVAIILSAMLDYKDFCRYKQLYILPWCLVSASNSDQNRKKMEVRIPVILPVTTKVPSIRLAEIL